MNRVLVALTVFALAAPPALAGGASGGVVNKGGIVSPNAAKPGVSGGGGSGVTPNGSKPGTSSGGGSSSPNGAKPGSSSGGGSGTVTPFGGKGGLSGDVHK